MRLAENSSSRSSFQSCRSKVSHFDGATTPCQPYREDGTFELESRDSFSLRSSTPSQAVQLEPIVPCSSAGDALGVLERRRLSQVASVGSFGQLRRMRNGSLRESHSINPTTHSLSESDFQGLQQPRRRFPERRRSDLVYAPSYAATTAHTHAPTPHTGAEEVPWQFPTTHTVGFPRAARQGRREKPPAPSGTRNVSPVRVALRRPFAFLSAPLRKTGKLRRKPKEDCLRRAAQERAD